jgi:hypothetical protein
MSQRLRRRRCCRDGHPPYLEKDKKVFTTKASCVCPKFKIYFLEK